jgi:predicted RecB family nuclease
VTVNPSLFQAFLKCPTKCWLRFADERPTGNTYAEWVQDQTKTYRADGIQWLQANVPPEDFAVTPAQENLRSDKWRLAVDVTVQNPDVQTQIHATERVPAKGRGNPAEFVPIRFIFANKLAKEDKLLLAFDGFALSEVLGRAVNLGKIIHGDERSTLKVKTSAMAGKVQKCLEKIVVLLSNRAPPDLVLNRHCAECEFQARCRQKAVEKDDLSLLGGMSEKERQKLRSKGVFTVTQLSYTFRPRRRPKGLRDKREKHHHSLRALAIREKKIHIVGGPALKVEGTPVYLDVEGLPDRDFYYLIGVRIGNGELTVQHSLWADTIEDEGKIWREFLGILEAIEKPVLVHYGSYETNFLKQMKNRYSSPLEGSAAAIAIGSTLNLVSVMFAQIYFPCHSNGLKDVADSLGYKWSSAISSGLESVVWRCRWERSSDAAAKRNLLTYNRQDCEALSLATEKVSALAHCFGPSGDLPTQDTGFVRADSSGLPTKSKWRTFKSPVTGFEYINAAAHWDYQRSRVYVRNGKSPRRPQTHSGRRKNTKGTDQIIIWPVSPYCPNCKRRVRLKGPQVSKTVQDIIFGRHSLKRRVVTYVFQTYRCWKCRSAFGVEERFSVFRKYGWNFVAYLFYQIVELCVPQITVARSFNRLFGFDLSHSTLNKCKVRIGRYYMETKRRILDSIVSGSLVHADETRANIKGTTGFVWVLTNMRDVIFVLADTREGEVIQQLLSGFKGVLVSDFYTAYDSLGCPQQRCLIHLMRDLNDEVLGSPFDEELKKVVTSFANLLKPMIETVDRHGLKKHFLQKHLNAVDCFYRVLDESDCQSEPALKCKERFERNRNKLFTFLNYDGVPWNNNNAEHAIKAFAKLRDVIAGSSTEKGIEEYLALLSACQTGKYSGLDFLDFLRSGEKDIHAFAESRRGRRRGW